jgi:hypothetical protein
MKLPSSAETYERRNLTFFRNPDGFESEADRFFGLA